VRQFLLPETAPQDELLGTIAQINADAAIHGCRDLPPLPKHIDDERVRAALSPEKDVDGITDGSLAGVFAGTKRGFRRARRRPASKCSSIRHRDAGQDRRRDRPKPGRRQAGRHDAAG
jgi:hypothetical protein